MLMLSRCFLTQMMRFSPLVSLRQIQRWKTVSAEHT